MARFASSVVLVGLVLVGCGDAGEGGSDVSGAAAGVPGAPSTAASGSLFNESEVNDVHLDMAPADWQSIIADDRGDEYRRTTVRWKSVTVTQVGVRPAGHATRFPGNAKPSMKLDFNVFVPGQKFLGLKSVKLEGLLEGTMVRERISYGVFRALVPAAPRTAHCRLFVNGEYRGVYMLEERVTRDLLDHRFGRDDGHLYRVLTTNPEAFAWRGPDAAVYMPRPFQPETHETDGGHEVLPHFLDVLNNRPAELGNVFDLENLISYLAIEVALISRDGILRDDGWPQNCFVIHRPETGRFELIPWDVDQTLSSDGVGRAYFSLWHNFGNTRIASVVRDTPELNARFRARLSNVIETLTHPAILGPRIEAVYQQIRPYVHTDPYKNEPNEEMDGVPAYLTQLLWDRYNSLRAELGPP